MSSVSVTPASYDAGRSRIKERVAVGLPFASIDLPPETEQLFVEMAEATLSSTTPAHRMFMLAVHLGGNRLVFAGQPRRDWKDVDPGALDDLASLGLLRRSFGGRGTPNYRLTNDGRRFFEWLMSRGASPSVRWSRLCGRGSAPKASRAGTRLRQRRLAAPSSSCGTVKRTTRP